MGHENLALLRSAFNRRDALTTTLRAALTSPDSLTCGTVDDIRGALRLDEDNGELYGLALGALAAVLYSRPDLVEDTLVDRLADLATVGPLPDDIGSAVARLFKFWPLARALLEPGRG
jgi:hypothetical protein